MVCGDPPPSCLCLVPSRWLPSPLPLVGCPSSTPSRLRPHSPPYCCSIRAQGGPALSDLLGTPANESIAASPEREHPWVLTWCTKAPSRLQSILNLHHKTLWWTVWNNSHISVFLSRCRAPFPAQKGCSQPSPPPHQRKSRQALHCPLLDTSCHCPGGQYSPAWGLSSACFPELSTWVQLRPFPGSPLGSVQAAPPRT